MKLRTAFLSKCVRFVGCVVGAGLANVHFFEEKKA